ncbi:irregular chiasm C-roughest protein-like [Mytilus edulis]|uniref:irregular chiasm C-roughest protein-like n=1 Tax=Mytilus edulis TaxID=6550 RepID=UPI0039F10778
MEHIEPMKQLVFYISIATVLFINTVLSVQTFFEQPRSHNATVNSTVIFKCVIQNKAGEVQWMHDGLSLGSDRDYSGYNRYSVIGGRNGVLEEFSLKITDVQLKDDGEYICFVLRTQSDPSIKTDPPVTLNVLVRPDPPVIQGGRLQKVTLGEHKNLTCTSANGKPGAEITWYKDSVRIVDKVFSVTDRNGVKDKRETTISHVTIIPTEEDHGKRIECRASNAVQIQPLKALATLDVQFKPSITLKVNITRKLREHDYVRFTCDAKANPSQITWKWYKDGEFIPGESKFTLDIANLNRDDHRSILMCEGENAIGVSRATTTLDIEYGPKFVNLNSHIPVDLGTSVTLTCEADGNPLPSIIWRRGSYPDALSTERQYTVHNIQDHDLGLYKCTASSINAGFAPIDAEIYLMRKDQPKITSSKIQYAAKGSTADIECKARSVPNADEVIWIRNGKEIDFASSERYSFSETRKPDGVINTLHVQDSDDDDFGVYNCTVVNSMGLDFMAITLNQKEILALSYIVGGVIGGVAVIFIIAIACVLYHRYKGSDNESYAETDSNTEIKKREKSDSPTEFQKGTLMDQWRQDLNFHCPPTDFDEVYGKMNGTESKVTSGYGTLRSENYINGYDNHNGHLFSDYIHRSDETIPGESQMDNGVHQYGTSTFRSRPDFNKSSDSDPYQLPPADISTTKLATNV